MQALTTELGWGGGGEGDANCMEWAGKEGNSYGRSKLGISQPAVLGEATRDLDRPPLRHGILQEQRVERQFATGWFFIQKSET